MPFLLIRRVPSPRDVALSSGIAVRAVARAAMVVH
jgi:hypothetical protein